MNLVNQLMTSGAFVLLSAGVAAAQAGNLPPDPKPGECYARVYTPAVYADRSERVLIREASKKIQSVDAKYEEVEERIVVEEPSERLQLIEARFEFVEETVVLQEAAERLISVPAEYAMVDERVLIRPATTVWKKGRGPIERIDAATGEIMCLVEVPAEYKTVKKRVVTTPASVRKEIIPAVTRTYRKRVMVEPPRVEKITIPAKYETVKVKKVVTPAREVAVDIPEEYATVAKRVKVSDGGVEWRAILCEVNVTPQVILQLQRALAGAGFDPGKPDGELGRTTMKAVERFQQARGLASGQLTMETLRALDVSLSGLK